MQDVAPAILEMVKNSFQDRLKKNRKIKSIAKKIEDGIATYRDADEYAVEVGDALAGAYMEITEDMLPDGKMYYNIADRVIRPTLEDNYEMVSESAAKVQKSLNEGARIGLNAVKPAIDNNRVQGIIDKVADADNFDTIKWVLEEPVRNFAQYVVDDTVRTNAKMQLDAGLQPKIVRTAEPPHTDTYYKRGKNGKRFGPYFQIMPCAWCQNLAGTYNYEDVKNTGNDVFRRHERCRCIVEYVPGDGTRQNVWDKTWQQDNVGDIEERIDTIAKAQETLQNQKIRDIIGIKGAPKSIDQARQISNPTQNTINCQRVIGAYELNRRGYNVGALPKPQNNNLVLFGSEIFKNKDGSPASFVLNKTRKQLTDELRSAPEGARYAIYIQWKGRGRRDAHVFNAEITNSGVLLLDAQTNSANVKRYLYEGRDNRWGWLRLDSLDITDDDIILKNAVKKND